jgi:hypothetical protein
LGFPGERGTGVEVVLSGRALDEVRMMGQNFVLVDRDSIWTSSGRQKKQLCKT